MTLSEEHLSLSQQTRPTAKLTEGKELFCYFNVGETRVFCFLFYFDGVKKVEDPFRDH